MLLRRDLRDVTLVQGLARLGVRQRVALLCGVVAIVSAPVFIVFGAESYREQMGAYLDAALDADADAAVEFVCEVSRPVVLDPAWAADARAQREQLEVRGFNLRRGGSDLAVVDLVTADDRILVVFDVGTEDGDTCVVVETGRPFGIGTGRSFQPSVGTTNPP